MNDQRAASGDPTPTDDELADLVARQCQFCGLEHEGFCPRVAEIQYYPNGTRRLVRFHPPPPPPKKEKDEKS